MAEPKKRMSVKRSAERRSRQFPVKVSLSVCPQCKKAAPAHQIHRQCLASFLTDTASKTTASKAA